LTPYHGTSSSQSETYTSASHGVYLRNAHGQEILLRPEGITWRTIGGSIDLYFYAGPSQVEVTKSFQLTAAGLPAMQQYWTFGFHQCRWGYRNWTELEDVVVNYEKFGIPLETIWYIYFGRKRESAGWRG
jgi:alpha-glucosidase